METIKKMLKKAQSIAILNGIVLFATAAPNDREDGDIDIPSFYTIGDDPASSMMIVGHSIADLAVTLSAKSQVTSNVVAKNMVEVIKVVVDQKMGKSEVGDVKFNEQSFVINKPGNA